MLAFRFSHPDHGRHACFRRADGKTGSERIPHRPVFIHAVNSTETAKTEGVAPTLDE